MSATGNDEWRARFIVDELGEFEYTVEGWVDGFETWRHDLSKKFGAGGRVERAARRGRAPAQSRVEDARADRQGDRRPLCADGEPVPLALAESLRKTMAGHADRAARTRYDRVLKVLVEIPRARCGAWYEMFPRSAGTDPFRSATFDEAAARLPYVSSMGFDVLYLPPIHPIGRSFRKGPNNSLESGPDDPGSPWAIGSEEGGHDAIEPGLGTLEDFDRFVESARRQGLEIALTSFSYPCHTLC